MSTIITVRYTNNTYHAKAEGSSKTATCTASPAAAADALLRKLGIYPKRLKLQLRGAEHFEYSVEEDATAIDELRLERNALLVEIEQLKAKCEQLEADRPADMVLVDKKSLGTVLQALVNAPHYIHEIRATREPAELFPDNPINILIANYKTDTAAQNGDQP